VDLTPWLDPGETIVSVLTHTISLGTTGWSDTPYPPPGAPPPYDPTPLLFAFVGIVESGTGVEMMVGDGTPGNVYTCQFEVLGGSNREVTFEVGVQITGTPPKVPPVITEPIPLDALSIYGGTMLGPLYLFRDPTYPTEAATKQYVDWATATLHVDNKVNRAGDMMTGILTLYSDPVGPRDAATKQYVDAALGSSLSDAPADGGYYGRRNLAWVHVVDEAPLNTFGYLRMNAGWQRGTPQVTTLTDVRITDHGGGVPLLSGAQIPASPSSDVFYTAARRAGSSLTDGGLLALYGPSHPTAPNWAQIFAGPASARVAWSFSSVGVLDTPGIVRSNTGRFIALSTIANSGPSFVSYDAGLGFASGFWVGGGGTLAFGPCNASTGQPLSTWATINGGGLTILSGGLSTPSLNVSGALSAGSLSSTGSISAALDVSAGRNMICNQLNANIVSAVFVSLTQDLSVGHNASISGTLTVGGNISTPLNLTANNANIASTVTAAAVNSTTQTCSTLTVGTQANIQILNVQNALATATGGWIYTSSGGGGFGGTVNVGGFFTSDARLKFDVASIDPARGIDWVRTSNPCTYRKRYHVDAPDDESQFEGGFIAQEQITAGFGEFVATVPCPGMPAYDQDGITAPADTQFALDSRYQIAMLTAACQQMLARIEVLEGSAR
jgi:Chaperone of endosialidase